MENSEEYKELLKFCNDNVKYDCDSQNRVEMGINIRQRIGPNLCFTSYATTEELRKLKKTIEKEIVLQEHGISVEEGYVRYRNILLKSNEIKERNRQIDERRKQQEENSSCIIF